MADKVKVMEIRVDEEDIQFLKALDYQREGQKVLLKELIRFDAEQEPADKELIAYYNELYIDTLAKVSLVMGELKEKYLPDLPEGYLVEVSYAIGTIYGTNYLMSEETKPSCACGIDAAETCSCCNVDIPLDFDSNYKPEEFEVEEEKESSIVKELYTVQNGEQTDMVVVTDENKIIEITNIVPVIDPNYKPEEVERKVPLEKIQAMTQEERESAFRALLAMYKGCSGECETCEEECADREEE